MKPEYSVQRSLNLLFQRTLFLMFHHFQKYLNLQCFLPALSFKINLRDTSFHISLNSLGFYLSRMFAEFSDLYIPTCAGKNFQFMVFTFLQMDWIYAFLLIPQSTLKTPSRIFWKSVSPNGKCGGSYDLLYQNSVKKYEDDLKH